MHLILNLAKDIKKNVNDNGQVDYFPTLFWIIRDFVLNLRDSNNNRITPNEYLENSLQNVPDTQQNSEKKNLIRRMIKHFFRDRQCVTLIRPVEEEQ